MAEKKMRDAKTIADSLLALKAELDARFVGQSGVGPEIAMKINSCLYSVYPHSRKEGQHAIEPQRSK